MMKLARLVLLVFLVAGWAPAQSGGQAMAAGDKDKKDSSAVASHKDSEQKGMSCGCCKDMGKTEAGTKGAMKADSKDASKAVDKDAKSEAKSEGGMMAGGCCAKMGKDKDAAGGGMKCGGGGKKAEDSKSGTLPE